MMRILAIDYGTTRVGLAVTDPLQIIATPLTTVLTKEVVTYLKSYFQKESVNALVVGMPKELSGKPSSICNLVERFVVMLQKNFPDITVHLYDERYTSRIAKYSIYVSGLKKSKRKNKALIDTCSATILLESFLQRRRNDNSNIK